MPLDNLTKRARYQETVAALVTERSSHDGDWRELGDFILPHRPRFTVQERNRGGKKSQKIIDSTATFAATTLESGMHAGLTSPARPWMLLTTPDPELAQFGPVKQWLHIVTQRMMAVFADSNLYNTLPIVYGDMGVFATGCAAILEDPDDLFRAYTFPIGSYALDVDSRGRACTFVREMEMTVRQVVERFAARNMFRGDREIDWTRVSHTVKNLWDTGKYTAAVEVCWIVTPNDYAEPGRIGSKHLPFASCHFEKASDGRTFLRESGFTTFPILAPRWKVTSHEDVYGTDCPGIRALGDVKQLQSMERKKGVAIGKMVDPPLVGPTSLMTQKTSLLSGDITFADITQGQQGLKSIHDIHPGMLQPLTMDQDRVRYRIQRAFYEDLFLMLATRDQQADSSQPVTAREIAERHEEKLLALGPVLERANDELLEPLVERVFAMMEAAGLIPDAPEDIDGVKLKVEFISVLAQAQKSVGVAAQDRFLQSVGGMVEVFPDVVHKVDVNQAVDNYADMLGVDPRLVRSNEDAQERAQQQAEAMKAQADAEQALSLAKAAQAAGSTPMQGDTALTRLLQGAAA